MRRLLPWTGQIVILAVVVAMGVFIAISERAEAKPPCNCPQVVPTPEGPCVLISCNGTNCQYRCP